MKTQTRGIKGRNGEIITTWDELELYFIEQDKEIERLKEEVEEWKHNATRINEDNNKLHSIIKEVREYIHWRLDNRQDMYITQMEELLEILQGSDKE